MSSVAQSIIHPIGGREIIWNGGFPGVWFIDTDNNVDPARAEDPPEVERSPCKVEVFLELFVPFVKFWGFSCNLTFSTADSSFKLSIFSSSLSSSYSSSAALILTSMLLLDVQ